MAYHFFPLLLDKPQLLKISLLLEVLFSLLEINELFINSTQRMASLIQSSARLLQELLLFLFELNHFP